MAQCDASSLTDYLDVFTGQDPLSSVICPYAGPNGAGMTIPVFGLLLIGMLGLGLTIRTQHPAPLIVTLILSAGLFATVLPGGALQIAAIGIMVAIAGAGLVIYQRSQSAL